MGLLAGQLPALLRQTPGGEQFQPTLLRFSLSRHKLELPVAMLSLTESVRGWESLLARNASQITTQFTERAGAFMLGSGTPQGERLATLQSALQREAGLLREQQKQAQTDYDATCAALRRQQAAMTGERPTYGDALIGVSFDAAKAVQLWNGRESGALRLDSIEAALKVLVDCAARVGDAARNLARRREYAQANVQLLAAEHELQRQQLTEVRCYVPDLALDHARLAAHLAQREQTVGTAPQLLFAADDSIEEVLVELRAGASADADRLVAGLSFAEAVEAQRQAEQMNGGIDALLLLGQAVLAEGCRKRSFAWAERPKGKRTLLQLTPDGRPLFAATMERGTMRAAKSGLPGQVVFIELVEDIMPGDLAVVQQAFAALAEAQGRQNNSLLDEVLPTEVDSSATPGASQFDGGNGRVEHVAGLRAA